MFSVDDGDIHTRKRSTVSGRMFRSESNSGENDAMYNVVVPATVQDLYEDVIDDAHERKQSCTRDDEVKSLVRYECFLDGEFNSQDENMQPENPWRPFTHPFLFLECASEVLGNSYVLYFTLCFNHSQKQVLLG